MELFFKFTCDADGIAKRVCKVEKIARVPAGSLCKVIAAPT